MTRRLVSSQVAAIVCARTEEWEAARLCCEALRIAQNSELESAPVPTADLRRTYRIRLMKPEVKRDLPIGSDRLLSDLESYQGKTIQLIAFGKPPNVYGIMLDESGTGLVTCFVGRDRRMLPKSPAMLRES